MSSLFVAAKNDGVLEKEVIPLLAVVRIDGV